MPVAYVVCCACRMQSGRRCRYSRDTVKLLDTRQKPPPGMRPLQCETFSVFVMIPRLALWRDVRLMAPGDAVCGRAWVCVFQDSGHVWWARDFWDHYSWSVFQFPTVGRKRCSTIPLRLFPERKNGFAPGHPFAHFPTCFPHGIHVEKIWVLIFYLGLIFSQPMSWVVKISGPDNISLSN